MRRKYGWLKCAVNEAGVVSKSKNENLKSSTDKKLRNDDGERI